MDDRQWARTMPWDRRWFRGYSLVAVQMALNLLVATNAAATEGMPGPLSVCLGALSVLFPLLARSAGQTFLARELQRDPWLWWMVGWRTFCWAIGFVPTVAALLWRP
jgi:hypothetical protein